MGDALGSSAVNEIYEFGPFRLEVGERRLLKDGTAIPLPPRVFDTLRRLVEKAGRIVTKEELMSFLWPDTSVEEGNLTKNVWLIRRALGEPDGETRFIETIPKSGYRFIAPVRKGSESASGRPDPMKTPAAEDAIAAAAVPARANRPVPPAVLVAAGVALLVAVGVLRTRQAGKPIPPLSGGSPAVAGRVRRSVAVLGLRNLSGKPEEDWLSTAIAEMVGTELASGEAMRLVPSENVARLGIPPRTATPGTLSRETLASLRARLDADLVLSGSYVVLSAPDGAAIRFDMTLQDAASGESLAAVTETGKQSDLFRLVSTAGGELRGRLGLGAALPSGALAALSPNGARFYADGLRKLHAFDALGARPLLETSIRIEPDFGPAHEALSETWSALGFDDAARTEAAKAFELAGKAPAPLRTSAEARIAEAGKDWPRAETLVASLFRSHPDDPEIGLRLASVQTSGGRAREALATLSMLAALPAPARHDPRIDLARADAAAALADRRGELAAARAAARKAATNGATLLIAEGRLREGAALRALGDPDHGRTSFQAAADLFRKAGDGNGEAEALIGIANAASDAGEEDESRALLREARSTFERIGNRKGEARVLSDLANLDWLRGDLDSALSESRRVLALDRSVGDPTGTIWGLNATGNILADQGEFDSALALQQEAADISRKIANDGYLSYSLASRADTFLAQGRLDDARRNYEEALALSKKVDDVESEATHENDLGNVFYQQGRISESDRHYQRALDLRRGLKLKSETAETLTRIAGLRCAEGRYREALQTAQEAADAFDGTRSSSEAATAFAALARAELGLGKVDEARVSCRKARALLTDTRLNDANLPVLLEEIRLETAAGHLDEARRRIAELETRARKSGWLFYVLEARRARAEIEILAGRKREGLRQIQSLEEEARGRGFGLVAAEARHLLSDPRS